jgi:hypothetical protein
MTIVEFTERVREAQRLADEIMSRIPKFEIDAVLEQARKHQAMIEAAQAHFEGPALAAARFAMEMNERNQALIDTLKMPDVPTIDMTAFERREPQISFREPSYMARLSDAYDEPEAAEEEEDVYPKRTIVRPALKRKIGFKPE